MVTVGAPAPAAPPSAPTLCWSPENVARHPRSSYWVSKTSKPWRCIPSAIAPMPAQESSQRRERSDFGRLVLNLQKTECGSEQRAATTQFHHEFRRDRPSSASAQPSAFFASGQTSGLQYVSRMLRNRRLTRNHGCGQARSGSSGTVGGYECHGALVNRKRAADSRRGEGPLMADSSTANRHPLEKYLLDHYGVNHEQLHRITARAIRDTVPELLDKPVGAIVGRRRVRLPQRPGPGRDCRPRQADDEAGADQAEHDQRDLRTLRAALKTGRKEYRFPGGADQGPMARGPEEELLVLEPMASPFREIAKLAALTLMRQGEIRLLRREYVHLEQGVVLLTQAKAGARPVVLSQAARKLLQAQFEGHCSPWVFP
jgi:hypothetical protein